jgi:hypothetical protein
MFNKRWKASLQLLASAILCVSCPSAHLQAQETPTNIDPQAFQALLQRVQELENRVRELESAQGNTASIPSAASSTAVVQAQPASASTQMEMP